MIDLFEKRGRWATYPSIADGIDASGDCWEWTRSKINGYGRMTINGETHRVHRLVWEALVGPMPRGMDLDHLCRNRACCNPDHLEVVSRRTNLLRGYGLTAKKAQQTHCIHGHKFTPENTYVKPNGTRSCRTCRRVRARKAFWDQEVEYWREG